MRVIAGTARSMPLKTIKGMDTRPTTDKTKETLFNVLQTDIPDCRFLDLFSGSGAIAIEALSRGAAHAVLVEQNANMALSISDRAYVLETGSIVMSGDAKELMGNDDIRKAYLGG